MRLRMRNEFAGPSVFKYTNKCAGGRPLCSSNGFVNKKIFMRWFFFRFHLLFCFRNMQAYTVVIAVVIAIIFYLPQLLCLCIDFYLIFLFFMCVIVRLLCGCCCFSVILFICLTIFVETKTNTKLHKLSEFSACLICLLL